ncbi:MAG: hypothetical protein IKH16_09635 [Selenomonadaceae bacterium]|nr:hypothetical protein [Selenomonadaceae bacterium]
MSETEKKDGKPTERQDAKPKLQAVNGGKQEEGSATVIYVGPPVKGTLLHSTFLIFEDGIPQEYRNDPVFKHLFVPPERLDQARKEIGRTGSFRNIYYQRAFEATRNKKGGE